MVYLIMCSLATVSWLLSSLPFVETSGSLLCS